MPALLHTHMVVGGWECEGEERGAAGTHSDVGQWQNLSSGAQHRMAAHFPNKKNVHSLHCAVIRVRDRGLSISLGMSNDGGG